MNCYHYYPLRREVLFNICFAAIQLTAYNENYEKTVYSVQVAAFLATYASKQTDGSIRHMPLQYALTEYRSDKEKLLALFDALVSLQPSLTVDGVSLTQQDMQDLLNQTEGLALLKGKWIEVNHEKLKKLLEDMKNVPENLSFREAMQLEMENERILPDVGAIVTNGEWLSGLLTNLKNPGRIRAVPVPKTLHAALRPYQKDGYNWLRYMSELNFGACLADDMGLGKTLQVLTFLERMRKDAPKARVLLIVPASLIGNWQKEKDKFAPDMTMHALYGRPSARLSEELSNEKLFSLLRLESR